jgi:DNA-binding transcriptional LysR family regulator
MAKFGDLKVAWLQAFVRVAETGKQTATAAELKVDQATISRHIRHLEQWLGGKLLLDNGVPAKLLPDGEKFLPVAREVLKLLEGARQPNPPPPA